MLRLISTLGLLAAALAASGPASAHPAAPDGTPICPDWVHDRHTVERGGRTWPTWHPPRDPVHRCAFGHEHGSSPRAFAHFPRTGMPAFGHVGSFAHSEEAHSGFKVFVVNRDRRGLAWMAVLHQGSGSPRRGAVRFHSLETWLFRRKGGGLAAHTRLMADFGEAVANCPGAARAASMRLLPSPECDSVYEEWATAVDVGGVFQASPAFAIDNAITQFDPTRPDAVVPNKRAACGPHDPAGWGSYCKGDKRTVLHPRWRLDNRSGPSRFRTDAYGRRTGTRAGLLQIVSRRMRNDQSEQCCGVENTFVMEQPSDGGIYRAGRGTSSRNFEFPGYCVLGAN
jgi:hypothetical protein